MDALFSKTVKSGKMTYFVDVKEAVNKTKYVSLTSTVPAKDEPGKFQKKSVVIFNNAIDEVMGALEEAAKQTK
jgi:hypothetical protein